MRELVALFEQEESRDELGIGAIRDAFSDRLFPGVSVIQSRARYLVFIPWIYRDAAKRKPTVTQIRARAETQERRLIEALRRGGDVVGLLGRDAGVGLKILPSAIYWTALQKYGIVRQPGSLEVALRSSNARAHIDEADELAERSVGLWHPTLPDPPGHFFDFDEVTFAVSRDEATWLTERIIDQVPDSLHGYLLLHRIRPAPHTDAPWFLPGLAKFPAELQRVIEHARLFSVAIQGAALLYNLLLARRYTKVISSNGSATVDRYEAAIANWWADIGSDPAITHWNYDEFWQILRRANPNVTRSTIEWVKKWLRAVADGTAEHAASDPQLALLIIDRERALKINKSRFINDRLLGAWKGSSGTEQLRYRWSNARVQIIDLLDGLEANRAGA